MEQKIVKDTNEFSYIHISKPENETLVVLIHGFGKDKEEDGNYTLLAEKLLSNGMDSIRFDLLGHGNSSGKSEDLTIKVALEEMEVILNNYQNYKNIHIVGTSYGGGLAILYAKTHKIDKLVLWSPLLDTMRNVIKPENHFCREFLGEEALKSIKEKGYAEFGISGKRINMNLFNDAKKYNPVTELPSITSKIKILHGTKDFIVPPKQSIDITEKYKEIELELIEDGTHCFYDSSITKVIASTILFLKK